MNPDLAAQPTLLLLSSSPDLPARH